ncbi:MAG: hypothetical protein MK080_04725 [Opitutales bacterium]|nr:hypothetical protein [Opitutales bacterium]NRA26704.1 hypothetical protein [Opitutales bacterium]
MAKVDIDTLKLILQRNLQDPRQINDIINDINVELQEQEAENEEKPPPVKKQFCMLVSDPEDTLAGKDYVGWVAQIPEDESPLTCPDRIIRAAYEYNQTPKGRRLPLETIGEACENVSAKYFKEQDIWMKTKIPVHVVNTNNKIPKFEDPGA